MDAIASSKASTMARIFFPVDLPGYQRATHPCMETEFPVPSNTFNTVKGRWKFIQKVLESIDMHEALLRYSNVVKGACVPRGQGLFDSGEG